METKQISRKISADLRATGVLMGGLYWSSRVFPGATNGHLFPGRATQTQRDEVKAAFEAKGYTVTPGFTEITVTHPAFTETNN